ncbi:MAG: hypothetical protein R3C40_04355 [Parvularculaceae bacterium]
MQRGWSCRTGDADDRLFVRDDAGEPLCFDLLKTGAFANANEPQTAPAFAGERTLPDGRRACRSFELLAKRYLSDEYAPATGRGEDQVQRRRSAHRCGTRRRSV